MNTNRSASNEYLKETEMLDFSHQTIQALVAQLGWRELNRYDAIGAIYDFVRDDIAFGYNRDDRISASQVLNDGYGQCNTKGTLLMALFRAVGIETRFHGFTIFNALQRGAIPNYLFSFAPEKIIHSWVEVKFEDAWINLEGYIIDQAYLKKVQRSFADQCHDFSGFGIATRCLSNPEVEWKGEDTFIQREGIADDFGVYDQPDAFYKRYGSNLSGFKKLLFRYFLRHLMNRNVAKIRNIGVRRVAKSVAKGMVKTIDGECK